MFTDQGEIRIKEKIIKILDNLPDEELEKVYWTVEVLQKDYLFRKNLQDKGAILSELFQKEAQSVNELWDNSFASDISMDTKKAVYYGQFKWHIFSYKIKDFLKEEAARNAFDAAAKDELYVMYQNKPYVLMLKNAKDTVSADFDSEEDIYIFDKDLTWTYVHTHESYCGPYFHRIGGFK